MSGPIEVYADLWCPFSHVGLRAAVAQRAAAGRDDVLLRVRPWPLELVNGAPMEPAKAAANAAALREQVAPALFAQVDVEHFPRSTLEALALVEAAYRQDPKLGEAASLRLRDALFEEGRDLSDAVVLAELAAELGIGLVEEADRAAIGRSLTEGRARGVVGSPHFFCGDRDVFCPLLEISRSDGELELRARAAELAGFLEGCFGA
jgi:predicted DsbA family dithiol-disulfide isomerase